MLIFGLGFTGKRVAKRLTARGVPVAAPARGSSVQGLPQGQLLLYTIPPLDSPDKETMRAKVDSLAPSRIVYISSTGVYGDQTIVDEHTAPEPSDERGVRRIEEEDWIGAGPWSSLILRCAAIYGPGRGVHVAAREGRPPRGVGSGVVSRIHVDDLAAIADAGLFSSLEGAWPVADQWPCPSEEIIRWCYPARPGAAETNSEPAVSPFTGRRVDGSAVLRILGLTLAYPSWKTGVPASIAEERAEDAAR